MLKPPTNVRYYLSRSGALPPRHGLAARVRVNVGQSSLFIRWMSSPSTKHLFIVYAPDYAGPRVLDNRFSVREKHLKDADVLRENGTLSACRVRYAVVAA